MGEASARAWYREPTRRNLAQVPADAGELTSQVTSSGKENGPAGWAYRSPHHDMREKVGIIKWTHAVVRIIHNPKTVDEHALILANLNEALTIFDASNSHGMRCETLNSLGTLKQKRKQFADAKEYYLRALTIRREKLSTERAGLAQACVSLGLLLIADQPPAEKQPERAAEALPYLMEAEKHYEAAFHPHHTKVAHAHKGLAECHMKLGDMEKAQEHLDKALEISKSSTMHMTELQALMLRLEEQRKHEESARRTLRRQASSGISLWRRALAQATGGEEKTAETKEGVSLWKRALALQSVQGRDSGSRRDSGEDSPSRARRKRISFHSVVCKAVVQASAAQGDAAQTPSPTESPTSDVEKAAPRSSSPQKSSLKKLIDKAADEGTVLGSLGQQVMRSSCRPSTLSSMDEGSVDGSPAEHDPERNTELGSPIWPGGRTSRATSAASGASQPSQNSQPAPSEAPPPAPEPALGVDV